MSEHPNVIERLMEIKENVGDIDIEELYKSIEESYKESDSFFQKLNEILEEKDKHYVMTVKEWDEELYELLEELIDEKQKK